MKRELDRRTNAHGEEVTLVWYPRTNSVEIEVRDPEAGYTRSAPVPGRDRGPAALSTTLGQGRCAALGTDML